MFGNVENCLPQAADSGIEDETDFEILAAVTYKKADTLWKL